MDLPDGNSYQYRLWLEKNIIIVRIAVEGKSISFFE